MMEEPILNNGDSGVIPQQDEEEEGQDLQVVVEENRPNNNLNLVCVSTDATQTEGDVVDGAVLIQPHPLLPNNHRHQNNNASFDLNGSGDQQTTQSDGGFLSSLFTMVLPVKKRSVAEINGRADEVENQNNQRTIATQTEEQDPISAKGQQLSLLLIQELSLQNPIPTSYRDDVYESLASCICDMLVKHSILFNGMIRRCHVTNYRIFCCIANEIFEANETIGQFNVSWGRIISLFAFAVRLAQEYRDDAGQLDSITRFLASYVTKHLIPFVRIQGGWETLVDHYPVPIDDDDAQMKRAMLWSGLCVGLMATMYVTSYLSSR